VSVTSGEPPRATFAARASDESGGRARRLASLAGALRNAGVPVALGDELDAATAWGLVDGEDRDEVLLALRSALRVQPPHLEPFLGLFDRFWAGSALEPVRPPIPRPPAAARRAVKPVLRWDPEARQLLREEEAPGGGLGEEPGYSAEALLRRRSFDQMAGSAHDLAAMERLLLRLARQLATRRSRRLVPATGKGLADLRRSFRRALRTGGELLSFARRDRAVEQARLVFLCDTSGSMDPHSRFLLTFALALRRAARRAEIFAFNTELVRLTTIVAPGKLALTLDRLAAAVPDWSGGTRIGTALATFVAEHLARCAGADTVVVILSDGLDRGEPQLLAEALGVLRRRVRRILWLNPLLGDPRYEPTARGMQAALPLVDHLLPAHNLESLARLLPHLAA
jgi:hypothetical protein